MTTYYSPIVFSQFTAGIYIPLGMIYLYINTFVGILYIFLAVFSLASSSYLYGSKAFVTCIFTGCSGLYLLLNLMNYGIIGELATLILIGCYLIVFGIYTISAFDAIVDDYMFEVLTGKVLCMPKHSCYQVGIRIVGSSICELGDDVLWNERYAYIQTEHDGKMNTVDNWVNNTDPDITYESNDITVHIWILERVNKYW